MKIMGAFIRDLTLFYLLSMNRISLVIMMKLSSYPLDLSEEKLIHQRMEQRMTGLSCAANFQGFLSTMVIFIFFYFMTLLSSLRLISQLVMILFRFFSFIFYYNNQSKWERKELSVSQILQSSQTILYSISLMSQQTVAFLPQWPGPMSMKLFLCSSYSISSMCLLMGVSISMSRLFQLKAYMVYWSRSQDFFYFLEEGPFQPRVRGIIILSTPPNRVN